MGSIKTTDNLFDDGKTIYNEYGEKIGTQYKNVLDDGVTTYDKYGNKVATSYKNVLDDGVSTYDKYGSKVATSYKNVFDDGVSTYDNYGNRIGTTYRDPWDSSSSTTYTSGGYGTSYSAGSGAYGSASYGEGTAPVYHGGYSYSGTPAELKKDTISNVLQIIGIVILVLDFIYGVIGVIKPDLVRFSLDILILAYAAGVTLVSFFSAFMYGELSGETIGYTILASLFFLYLCGQGTYNANGYSASSASMAWRAVADMAKLGIICLAGGWVLGLIAERLFSGKGKDGRLGTVCFSLIGIAVLYGAVHAFTSVALIPVKIYIALCAALSAVFLYGIIRRHGKRGVFRGLLYTLLLTGGFTALVHLMQYRRGIGSLISSLTSMVSLYYYITFGAACIAGMIAGAIAKKRKQ